MFISDYRQLATNLFSDIYQLSFDGVGVTRQSYGPGETAVADYLSRFAREEGLSVHIDSAANLIFSQKGVNEDTPAVWIGSHIDSVPQGGNFDGLAGVIEEKSIGSTGAQSKYGRDPGKRRIRK